jgi:DNA-binding transcriptional ArsR family regulator
VFTHTVHGGLGRVAARLFDVLDDGAYGGLSVAELAALTGLHPRTISRHLVGLQAAGLVAAGDGGRRWARSLSAGDPGQLPGALEGAAVLLGCAGATGRRRERHAAQRQAFVTFWTDFAARRGWAVQRGLYRPEQPQLPLPQAA